jgi:hypothetical protein
MHFLYTLASFMLSHVIKEKTSQHRDAKGPFVETVGWGKKMNVLKTTHKK